MKVKRLELKEGKLHVDGIKRLCPFTDLERACGEWCALFIVERPFEGQLKIHMNCTENTTYEG